MPPGFHPAAASTQRLHGGTGWLVRASARGPTEETADGGGGSEEDQEAGGGPEGPRGTIESGATEIGGAEGLFGAEAHSDGKRDGGERHRI